MNITSVPGNEYHDKNNCLIILVVVNDNVVLIRVDELNVYESPLFPILTDRDYSLAGFLSLVLTDSGLLIGLLSLSLSATKDL